MKKAILLITLSFAFVAIMLLTAIAATA